MVRNGHPFVFLVHATPESAGVIGRTDEWKNNVRIRHVPVRYHPERSFVRISVATFNRSQQDGAVASILGVTQRVLNKEANMLSWAVTFLVIALIAGVLGLSGVAGTATHIAYVLFVVFLIVAAASFIMGRRPPVT